MPTVDIILPAQLTTELEAVNVCITSMGEAPVATLTPSPSPDVDKALGALNEASRQVQSRGWKWNQEVSYPLSLGPDGTVALPYNLLELSSAYFPQGFSTPYPVDIVARGTQLYDRANHTSIFKVAPVVDITVLLEWSLVPEKARRVITLMAVELFQSRDQQSPPALQVNAKQLQQAWGQLEQGEDKEGPNNQLYGNVDTTMKVLGTGSLRRNRLNG